jgi:hypothetical protein
MICARVARTPRLRPVLATPGKPKSWHDSGFAAVSLRVSRVLVAEEIGKYARSSEKNGGFHVRKWIIRGCTVD